MTLTREEAAASKEMDSLRVHADLLLSLSSPARGDKSAAAHTTARRRARATEGVFECKTCGKRFPSFQALGGHRTSHTRLQARLHGPDAAAAAAATAASARTRMHECTVCGLEFSMGQALGGHMRRHRAAAAQPGMPDLNYPPSECCGGGDSETGSSEPQLLNLLV